MKFLKKIFYGKKKPKVIKDNFIEKELGGEIQYRNGNPICEKCNLTIGKGQKIKTFNGKKFHLKPCWRQIQKEAKKQAFR